MCPISSTDYAVIHTIMNPRRKVAHKPKTDQWPHKVIMISQNWPVIDILQQACFFFLVCSINLSLFTILRKVLCSTNTSFHRKKSKHRQRTEELSEISISFLQVATFVRFLSTTAFDYVPVVRLATSLRFSRSQSALQSSLHQLQTSRTPVARLNS